MSIPEELLTVKKIITKTTGLPADNNHDPSNVIYHNGLYYFWYTQHYNDKPYDHFKYCKLMYKTSPDGINWSGGRDALLPSKDGWDSSGVLTAFVVPYEKKYYLFYIGVDDNFDYFTNGKRGCGLAVSDSPDGPWERFGDKQILCPSDNGWDNEGCDDITVLYKDGKWLMYYKGNQKGSIEAVETLVGLAVSDCITGPYKKYEGNPLIKGHAFSIWPYRHGFLYLGGIDDGDINPDPGNDLGDYWKPGRRSLFWSEDGISFESCCQFPNVSSGIFTSLVHDGTQTGITKFWGLMVQTDKGMSDRYIYRFDMVRKDE
jgi:predicted GH43/DUF377 family glycosyl hydrolase